MTREDDFGLPKSSAPSRFIRDTFVPVVYVKEQEGSRGATIKIHDRHSPISRRFASIRNEGGVVRNVGMKRRRIPRTSSGRKWRGEAMLRSRRMEPLDDVAGEKPGGGRFFLGFAKSFIFNTNFSRTGSKLERRRI
ncbi:MAG: hypothetical protein HY314_10420 [Acidobacteria bacterium]|nr:hypothetical protein [Acidobacteriota bacterium]